MESLWEVHGECDAVRGASLPEQAASARREATGADPRQPGAKGAVSVPRRGESEDKRGLLELRHQQRHDAARRRRRIELEHKRRRANESIRVNGELEISPITSETDEFALLSRITTSDRLRLSATRHCTTYDPWRTRSASSRKVAALTPTHSPKANPKPSSEPCKSSKSASNLNARTATSNPNQRSCAKCTTKF
jgi:hypothetical protein